MPAKLFLVFSLSATLLCGLIYATMQQTFRRMADIIPVQWAEDAAAALARGEMPGTLKSSAKVDLGESLSPYLIYLNDAAQPITSTAVLNGQEPVPPKGVFATARRNGRFRVTWQPRPGVRSATCIIHFTGKNSGFVAAGHSLRETERNIGGIGHLIFAGWAFLEAALLVPLAATAFWPAKEKEPLPRGT
ncbi:MAG: hypothetical protein ACLQVY_14255 [Limisphaerales bacterium]